MTGGFGAPTRPDYALTRQDVRPDVAFHTYQLGKEGSGRRGTFLGDTRIRLLEAIDKHGSITETERAQVRSGSPVGVRYDTAVNRESAAEMLAARAQQLAAEANAPAAKGEESGGLGKAFRDLMFGNGRRQGVVESVAKQTTRNVGAQIGHFGIRDRRCAGRR